MSWLLPELSSAHGGAIDRLLAIVFSLIIAIFIGWFVYFVVVLVRFRSSRNPAADYHGARTAAPHYLEVLLFAVKIGLLALVALPVWRVYTGAVHEPHHDPVEVRVVAQQFVWLVHYPGPDGVFGRTNPAHIDEAANPIGLDRSDPAAADDIVLTNHLYLPVDRPVLIHLFARDVVHGFYLPEFRVKQDAIPGIRIPVRFTPTMTTEALRERTGDPERGFEIVCAQLCGLGHYNMRGFVHVLRPEAYAAWLADQAPREDAAAYDPFWD